MTTHFTDDEKLRFCSVLAVGCDRETACNLSGKTAQELRRELEHDAKFHSELLRAEASPELKHMRNVFDASETEKNWRASVWWLERRSPERFGRRAPDTVSTAQLRQVIDTLTDAIVSEVQEQPDRRRVFDRLRNLSNFVQSEMFEENDYPTTSVELDNPENEQDSDADP